MKRLELADIIPQEELLAWRASLPKVVAKHCPEEVKEFITAMSKKLPDFQQYQVEKSVISGSELILCGVTEMKGEKISHQYVYDLPVPRMQAVDHHTAMHRIYNRRGKQGLIDYVTARVKDTQLERLLNVLHVHVFHEERPEFRKVMDEIRQSKKIEMRLHP